MADHTQQRAEQVRWGEDNPIENAPVLTEEEQDALKQKMLAMDKLLADQGVAKFKIEVFFSHKRKLHGLSAGMITVWESGTKFHGGGDTRVYLCPGRHLGRSNCESAIPDAANGYGFLVCPACKTTWKDTEVHGELAGNWSAQTWAKTILRQFVRLGHNADIYLKYPKHDLRVAAAAEQQKQLHGEQLARVRGQRVQYIYPLRNIIQDTANGADLLSRFYAFLTA